MGERKGGRRSSGIRKTRIIFRRDFMEILQRKKKDSKKLRLREKPAVVQKGFQN